MSAHPHDFAGIPAPQIALDQSVVTVAGLSDVGQVRIHNEDAYLVAALSDEGVVSKGEAETIIFTQTPTFLVVADGVGGAASGDIASLMATDTMLIDLRRQYGRGLLGTAADVERGMYDAIETANRVIHSYATTNPRHHGMASTATVAVVFQQTLVLAQVGDSRAYLIRHGKARQITKDQSLVQQLVDAGQLTMIEAEQSERKNIILQALGFDEFIMPDMYQETLQVGDIMVLCSDGLSNQVHPDELAEVILDAPSLPNACHRLIDVANDRGGFDNITVVVARFDRPGDVQTAGERVGDTSASGRAGAMLGSKLQGFAARVRQWLR